MEMKGATLGDIMEGKTEMTRYAKTNGYYHYTDEDMSKYDEVHGIISQADFGKFCHYQGVLVGLSLTIQLESGFCCGRSFEAMSDIQELFNDAKATYLKDLLGTPVLVAEDGMRVKGVKINKPLVVSKANTSVADKISFFTSACKKIHMLEQEVSNG